MRQRWWLELIKDYDLQILYHLWKANTIADALSRKSMGNLSCLLTSQKKLLCDLERNEIEVVLCKQDEILAAISAQPAIIEEIREKELDDESLKKIMDEIDSKLKPGFVIENGVLKFHNRLCVPDCSDLKKRVMTEAYNSKFAMHPGNTKIYHDLKQNFWWPGMKKSIANFVARLCQYPLYLTEIRSSRQDFIKVYNRLWELNCD
ncbi:uncharacterized protein LOC114296908 [Camellia sinensis]|uniref:uncharacterized protein LOC114296908 n=1 Tax=Camellia sinensis TaxID=4442 RepID=UPI001036D49D|nr:uncharacterized protein LOC114296908 [Camellia sinensis]